MSYLKYFLVLSVFIFSGCAFQPLMAPTTSSIIKEVTVSVNMRSKYKKYFNEGLKGSSAINFTDNYEITPEILTNRKLSIHQVNVVFSNQDERDVLEMELMINTSFREEKKFKATIDILVGEILKAIKNYNEEKVSRMSEAINTSVEEEAYDSSKSVSIPSFNIETNKNLKPIHLPKI